MEYQVDDDQQHYDSDDVSGIQGFASWTSLINQPAIVLTVVDLSSSCQSLTIFKRFGPSPTNLETSDTIGRTFTTLFMTLTGLLAFMPTILAGRPAITSATAISRRRHPVDLDNVAKALPVLCPTQG